MYIVHCTSGGISQCTQAWLVYTVHCIVYTSHATESRGTGGVRGAGSEGGYVTVVAAVSTDRKVSWSFIPSRSSLMSRGHIKRLKTMC